MTVSTNILNAKIYIGGRLLEGGISIESDKILKIGKASALPRASKELDAKGLVAIPGLIDAHVHLRDLQLAYKEDFYTGTCAAAAGGFTTVVDMPNTIPPTDSAQRLLEKYEVARNKVITNLGFHAAFVSDPTEVERMAEAGAISLKINFYRPISGLNVDDDEYLVAAMSRCGSLSLPIAVHAEDRQLVESIRKRLLESHVNRPSSFLDAHGAAAELKSVRRALSLARRTGARIHFCHLSLRESVEAVGKARLSKASVTCEVTPHHMFLVDDLIERYGGIALTEPPLRSAKEASGLWRALVEGEIDIIASDHAPHTLSEKQQPDVWEVKPGIPGLETTLPLLLTRVNQGEMTIKRLVETLSERPAEIFGLRGRGCLEEGLEADITLVDMKAKFRIDSGLFHSKAKYSPFDGVRGKGRPVKTFVSGRLVMEDGVIFAKAGSGNVLRREMR